MERHGKRTSGTGADVKGDARSSAQTSEGGRAESDRTIHMVDTKYGTGRHHAGAHSVYSRRTTSKADAENVIAIAIHGFNPMPKQGDRSARRSGKIHHYRDPRVTSNAQGLTLLLGPHAPPEPWEGPVAVELIIGFPFRKRESPAARESGWDWKDTKPDCDNLAKQGLDVLQHCGYFKDDAQVVRLMVTKIRMGSPVFRIQIIRLAGAPLESRPPWFVLSRPG